MKKIKDIIFSDEPNGFEKVMLLVVVVMMYTTMYYTDNLVIFTNAYNNLDTLFRGDSLAAFGSSSLPYGVIHQLICEVWVSPIFILNYIIGMSSTGVFAILWYKLCIVLFFTVCVKELFAIATTIGVESRDRKWLFFLFSSTILVVLPVFHVAQTDSLYLWMVLKGVHELIKRNNSRFLMWFAIAISFKTIPIFAFIPLVLLTEKRVIYVIRNIVIGSISFPIQQIWYRIVKQLDILLLAKKTLLLDSATESVSSAVESAVSASPSTINGLYGRVLKYVLGMNFSAILEGYTASIFIFLLAILCIYCYATHVNEENRTIYIIITSAVAYLIFFLTTSPAPYWIIVLYPSLYLLVFYKGKKSIRINMLLFEVFTISLFIVLVVGRYWVYGGAQTFDYLILAKLNIVCSDHYLKGYPYIGGYLSKLGIEQFISMIVSFCVACGCGLIWINRAQFDVDEQLDDGYVTKLYHYLAIFHILTLYFWLFGNIILLGKY